jgi:hypothetical protein
MVAREGRGAEGEVCSCMEGHSVLRRVNAGWKILQGLLDDDRLEGTPTSDGCFSWILSLKPG